MIAAQYNWSELISAVLTVTGFFVGWLLLRRIKRLPTKSTQELKEILTSSRKFMYYQTAIVELKKETKTIRVFSPTC
jgi:H+/Cl- antiporter ClcA